ncbi:hypothetical protein C484_08208, partial [Natrialba taiwanensis DSM 12281]
ETRYRTDDGYQEVDIDRFTVADSLTIDPGTEETRTVSVDIPYPTPLTVGGLDVWIETELDIDLAADPEDKEYLTVKPTPPSARLRRDGRLGFPSGVQSVRRIHTGGTQAAVGSPRSSNSGPTRADSATASMKSSSSPRLCRHTRRNPRANRPIVSVASRY